MLKSSSSWTDAILQIPQNAPISHTLSGKKAAENNSEHAADRATWARSFVGDEHKTVFASSAAQSTKILITAT